ncbi:MAG: ABC transporter ATP-binding protein [Acidobacteriota bacterium]
MLPSTQPILKISGLDIAYKSRLKGLKTVAAEGVSFNVYKNETVGLIGESGAGKSSIANAIIGLVEGEGDILLHGKEISTYSSLDRYKKIQYIFQDPTSSLDPRYSVFRSISEPLINLLGYDGTQCDTRVRELLDAVGIPTNKMHNLPHEFSGGQKQRIAIARALAVNPEIILADEPLSSLDISVQAQIIHLFQDLQKKFELAFIFISHDLNVIWYLSDYIVVLLGGVIVEKAPKKELFQHPAHPYTKELLSTVITNDKENGIAKKQAFIDASDMQNPEGGCIFYTKCSIAQKECMNNKPLSKKVGPDHWVTCYNVKAQENCFTQRREGAKAQRKS